MRELELVCDTFFTFILLKIKRSRLMAQVSEKIRQHISQGEYEIAIETLVSFLKVTGGDLYNQAILLKGKFSEYMREKSLGLSDKTEVKSQITMAVLGLADQIDERNLENPPTPQDFEKMRPDRQQVQQQSPQQGQQGSNFKPNAPSQPNYAAQCFFSGDLMQYFITSQNQIVAVNPLTNQSFVVGMKVPSQDFRFAWVFYVSATGIYYLVDHGGLIWGQNFGMPAQFGYVRYF